MKRFGFAVLAVVVMGSFAAACGNAEKEKELQGKLDACAADKTALEAKVKELETAAMATPAASPEASPMATATAASGKATPKKTAAPTATATAAPASTPTAAPVPSQIKLPSKIPGKK